MSNRKRVIIIVLIIVTIGLGGASILLSQMLQNSQAPNSSKASGFGETATKDLYEPLSKAFETTGCVGLLSPAIIDYYVRDDFSEVNKYSYEYYDLNTGNNIPVHCFIDLDVGRKIELELHAYDKNSDIASSKDALYSKVNTSLIKSKTTSGSFKQTQYFFGEGVNNGECITTIFNTLNEFEYLKLVYQNFDKSCNELTKLNGEVSYVIGNAITDLIILTREKQILNQ